MTPSCGSAPREDAQVGGTEHDDGCGLPMPGVERRWHKKEINVLAGSALAICNPLCHYTKLPLSGRAPGLGLDWLCSAPRWVACSHTPLQSKHQQQPQEDQEKQEH